MKIFVNASTLVVGGGIQVAASYISQAIRDPNADDFRFAISLQVMENLDEKEKRDNRIIEIFPSPARLWVGRHARKRLQILETSFQPDVVFTVFGPAYLQFKAPHVCGFAVGWTTHRTNLALKSYPFSQRFRRILLAEYKRRRLSSRDYYLVEADVARRGLIRLLGIKSSQITVIPNTYAKVFQQAVDKNNARMDDGITRVFCLAAPYPHKNLIIIPEVASILRNRSSKTNYKFIVTLPIEGDEVKRFWKKAEAFDVLDMIENVGRLRLSECPQWYTVSDIVFLPTLLETFSATYPEAMIMGKPIVTTDLDFAHDICGDAAAYFKPLNAESAADTIGHLASNQLIRESLIRKGYKRLAHFPSPYEKYRLIMEWLSTVANDR